MANWLPTGTKYSLTKNKKIMLSTKNVSTTGTNGPAKTISPGNVRAKINSVTLEEFKFKPGSYHMVLHLEGEEMGDGFEGFLIDKDNPEAGRYKGQVGRVKTSEWAYADGETKTGMQVSRDIEILKAIKNICTAVGAIKWYDAQDEKHPTIESFMEAFNSDAPFKDKWLDFCVAGKEYQSKQGYTNYDMYLPKFAKGTAPYVAADEDDDKLISFDPSVHIKKTEAKPVESFGEEAEVPAKARVINKDFEL